MGLPGYYISNPMALVVLPVAERYGAAIGEQREDLLMETERGKRYVYNQFKRTIRTMTFRVTESQLVAFRTLHEAVNGQATPFYWVVDTDDSASGVLYVRKEKDFRPTELDQPTAANGIQVPMYDYVLSLTGEPTDAQIDA